MTSKLLIDVREPQEFALEHIPNSQNIPLSQISDKISDICKEAEGKKVIFLCQSGYRAKKALDIWKRCTQHEADAFNGGLIQWKLANQNDVVCDTKFPIVQQVQLTVGLLLIFMSIMTYFISIYFLIPILFFGCGLTIAGLTGFCGLAKILLKMPWNKAKI